VLTGRPDPIPRHKSRKARIANWGQRRFWLVGRAGRGLPQRWASVAMWHSCYEASPTPWWRRDAGDLAARSSWGTSGGWAA
jgi:hypothetical protein